ncbi:MAG: hypothetical protein KAR42_15470 [candidate division Zixibacteria bacterium]|nr:hypothetical protein [candidate division Zixibacteria bacterium]
MSTFTEEEVNQMLANQEIKLRITGVENAISTLTKNMVEHMTTEEREMDQIMEAIEAVGKERRDCEIKLNKTADERHEQYHKIFVKRRDLYVVAAAIIISITSAFAFFTWQSTRSSNESTASVVAEVVKQLAPLIEKANR